MDVCAWFVCISVWQCVLCACVCALCVFVHFVVCALCVFVHCLHTQQHGWHSVGIPWCQMPWAGGVCRGCVHVRVCVCVCVCVFVCL